MPDVELDLEVSGSAYAFIKAELAVYGLEVPSDATLKLKATAGKNPEGVTIYRPHALIAAFIARAINTTHLQAGEGATFRLTNETIAAWEQEQLLLDTALGLTVPLVASGVRSKGSFSVRSRVVYD